MKFIAATVCAVALAVPCIASAESKNYGCDSINFGEEVLAKMPNAKKLCRGIKEMNGTVYVHYIAEIESKDANSLTVKFLDKDNKAVSRVAFEPTADQKVTVDKKPVKYASLEKGQKLDFWIAQNKWSLYASPDGEAMKILSVEHL